MSRCRPEVSKAIFSVKVQFVTHICYDGFRCPGQDTQCCWRPPSQSCSRACRSVAMKFWLGEGAHSAVQNQPTTPTLISSISLYLENLWNAKIKSEQEKMLRYHILANLFSKEVLGDQYRVSRSSCLCLDANEKWQESVFQWDGDVQHSFSRMRWVA